jgi:hypothetical protein
MAGVDSTGPAGDNSLQRQKTPFIDYRQRQRERMTFGEELFPFASIGMSRRQSGSDPRLAFLLVAVGLVEAARAWGAAVCSFQNQIESLSVACFRRQFDSYCAIFASSSTNFCWRCD